MSDQLETAKRLRAMPDKATRIDDLLMKEQGVGIAAPVIAPRSDQGVTASGGGTGVLKALPMTRREEAEYFMKHGRKPLR